MASRVDQLARQRRKKGQTLKEAIELVKKDVADGKIIFGSPPEEQDKEVAKKGRAVFKDKAKSAKPDRTHFPMYIVASKVRKRFGVDYQLEDVLEALERNHGLVHNAAIDLEISATTLFDLRKKFPAIHETMKACRKSNVDLAHGCILDNIAAGNPIAAMFYLKTQGKDQGFVENPNIHIGDGGALNVSFNVTAAPAYKALPEGDVIDVAVENGDND